MRKNTLSPNPSPSGRGEYKEAIYRASASNVMVQIARNLRQQETPSEKIMWHCLRGRRLHNLKFRRQHPVANTAFVADFLCYEASLIVEIDGLIHNSQQTEDKWRQSVLESEGYTVLRFNNQQVKQTLESVLIEIVRVADYLINDSESPSPSGRRI